MAVGYVAPDLDAGEGPERWQKWRPSVALCLQKDLPIDTFYLFHEKKFDDLAKRIAEDIQDRTRREIGKATDVKLTLLNIQDPWRFADVYPALLQFCKEKRSELSTSELLVHTSTGTHVIQICLFLLTHSRALPGLLIQTYQPPNAQDDIRGTNVRIDLHSTEHAKLWWDIFSPGEALPDVQTRSRDYEKTLAEIKQVADSPLRCPILLLGATGTGKTVRAKKIAELWKLGANYHETNCATLRGDLGMSELFGHEKGAFTGADKKRDGLLKLADNGVLFLDEIGELPLEYQAMLLKAIDEKRFRPLGATEDVSSNFQLICATNRPLREWVREKRFRDDLWARISVETFILPGLRERGKDDIEEFFEVFYKQCQKDYSKLTITPEARDHFLKWATSSRAEWHQNLRDLRHAVIRMANRADADEITLDVVKNEIKRLTHEWNNFKKRDTYDQLGGAKKFGPMTAEKLLILRRRLEICRKAVRNRQNEARAAKLVFPSSLAPQPALQKYLRRHGVSFTDIRRLDD